MCNHCSSDPRDRISQAEQALWGLRTLMNQLPLGEDVSAQGVASIVALIHERLDGASTAIQSYVPRDV